MKKNILFLLALLFFFSTYSHAKKIKLRWKENYSVDTLKVRFEFGRHIPPDVAFIIDKKIDRNIERWNKNKRRHTFVITRVDEADTIKTLNIRIERIAIPSQNKQKLTFSLTLIGLGLPQLMSVPGANFALFYATMPKNKIFSFASLSPDLQGKNYKHDNFVVVNTTGWFHSVQSNISSSTNLYSRKINNYFKKIDRNNKIRSIEENSKQIAFSTGS